LTELTRRSATSVGAEVDTRLASETVHPVQLAALSQIMGGPPPAANTFSKLPNTDELRPKAAADPRQYLRKSLRDTCIGISFFDYGCV
jgi:hypothetical protein